MARSIWTGTISFGLIAIPVKLFTAVRHQGVSFNQLDGRTMSRIKYQKVSEDTGEEVPSERIVKGYEVSKGRYIAVSPDELEPFMPAVTKTIDLEEFVALDQIDPVYFDTAYYIAPHLNPKPYVLLARALESSGKVAIARFVMRNRQYTAAIRAEHSRLIMSTLVYADEVVPANAVDELVGLDEVDVADREVRMAEMLVESLTAEFDPAKYTDEYRVQVLDLIGKKATGEAFELPATAAEAPKVVDLMAALEASVEAAKASRQRHPTARSTSASGAERKPAKRSARTKRSA
jgi:DNA end-binding protein Ku